VNIFAKMDCNGRSVGIASMVRKVSDFTREVWEVGPDILIDHFDLRSKVIVVKNVHLGLKKL